MKKLAIIGRGTAGCLGVAHFLKYTDWEIDWYFDENIKTKAVGESSNAGLSVLLRDLLDFEHYELKEFDGNIKTCGYKEGWGKGKGFYTTFPPPNISYHFNANKLQDYIFNRVKDNKKLNVISKNTKHDKIDSDFILDCSGRPTNFDDYYLADYIPVNSVYVTQCYWDCARFNHTLSLARKNGWAFGIPLSNRCSIGHLYNNKINSLDEIKEDVKEIFEKYNLVASHDTISFSFNSYYKKENFSSRIAYNGDASFFLEPLEATAIGYMDTIQRWAFDIWNDNHSPEEKNYDFLKETKRAEHIVMLHYFAGSIYNSKFWTFAEENASNCMKNALSDDFFLKMVNNEILPGLGDHYRSWGPRYFQQNMVGLGIIEKINNLKTETL